MWQLKSSENQIIGLQKGTLSHVVSFIANAVTTTKTAFSRVFFRA